MSDETARPEIGPNEIQRIELRPDDRLPHSRGAFTIGERRVTFANMTVVGSCGNCRWWERRAVDSTSFGWCRYLASVKTDIGEAIIRGEWNDRTVGEKVFTGEDFGCIDFEARPAAHEVGALRDS